jgi:CelD/BcsL family acetyltransferase involved in cellulose biosynthesis
MFRSLAPALGAFAELRLGPVTKRWTASLEGGFDGWFARRSPKFRTNARRDLRKAQEAGVVIAPLRGAPDEPQDAASLYARIQRVEALSWKGELGSGFVTGDMRAFYGKMLPRLIARGALRALVAQKDGADVAFIFGGVLGGTYRGLQVSFDKRYRDLALGNVMQLEMIRRLAEEGLHTYDLGSDMEYKARWSEPGLETTTLIAFKR